MSLVRAQPARRGESARAHSHRSRGAVERPIVATAAPRPWTGSFGLHADLTIRAKLACALHGRGPCRSQRKQYPKEECARPSRGLPGLARAAGPSACRRW